MMFFSNSYYDNALHSGERYFSNQFFFFEQPFFLSITISYFNDTFTCFFSLQFSYEVNLRIDSKVQFCRIDSAYLYFFVFFSYNELKQRAQDAFIEARLAEYRDLDEFVVPRVDDVWGSSFGRMSKEAIVKDITELRKLPYSDANMQRFLKHIHPGYLRLPASADPAELLPRSAPVLDYLRVYRLRAQGWRYPAPQTLEDWSTKRAVSHKSLRDVMVREIFVGSTPASEVTKFAEWVHEKHTENQAECPTNVLSLDVEEMQCCAEITSHFLSYSTFC